MACVRRKQQRLAKFLTAEDFSSPQRIANSHGGADGRDCFSLLVESRCPPLRGLSCQKLKELADNAVGLTYGEGRLNKGDLRMWDRLHVVCEGEALVRVHAGSDGWTTVAALRRGDCFGSPVPTSGLVSSSPLRSPASSCSQMSAQSTDLPSEPSTPCSLASLVFEERKGRPWRNTCVHKFRAWTWRIEWTTPQVKVYQLPGDPALEYEADDTDVDDLNTLRLLYLWAGASTTAKGVMSATKPIKNMFNVLVWQPMLDDLAALMAEVKSRSGTPADKFFLSGVQIVALRDRVMRNTQWWYGHERGGNLSAFYRWFIDAMNASGVVRFDYRLLLPRVDSKDGWLSMVDLVKKKEVVSSLPQPKASDVSQKQGVSAIDNTILCNVFTKEEYLDMRRRHVVRNCLVNFVRILQKIRLRKNGVTSAELSSDGLRSRVHLKKALATMKQNHDPSVRLGVAARHLEAEYNVVQFFRQLDEEGQQQVQSAVGALLAERKADATECLGMDSSLFQRYVVWRRKFPDRYFESDTLTPEEAKRKHTMIHVAGLFSGQLCILTRSAMEKLTHVKFIPLQWRRRNQLWLVADERMAAVRTDGIDEISRIRANEMPYVSYHGISLSKGGAYEEGEMPRSVRHRLARRTTFKPTLLQELQWVNDPSGSVANWDITDIEKIVHESWLLNPRTDCASEVLASEGFFSVGQNPNVSSSIGPTQHTQIAEAAYTASWMARLNGMLWQKDGLDARVELVSIPATDSHGLRDSVYLKATYTAPPAAQLSCEEIAEPAGSIVRLFINLRFRLLTQLGGSRNIDFVCRSFGGLEDGQFVLILVPICQCQRAGERVVNPLTGETGGHWPVYGMGFGHLTGQVQTEGEWLDELRALGDEEGGGEREVRRMLIFNRVPGVRRLTKIFLKEQGFGSALEDEVEKVDSEDNDVTKVNLKDVTILTNDGETTSGRSGTMSTTANRSTASEDTGCCFVFAKALAKLRWFGARPKGTWI
mmetsp:Transcript_97359/g.275183  ORF Transcript_97359/g.275183 Transcript_97359/m.275183 type:complete len:989 (-) Transcript_97359:71-3037(-)